MNKYGGGSLAPPIFTSAVVGGEWSALTSQTLYPEGKSPQYPLDRRMGRPQNRYDHIENCKKTKLCDLSLRTNIPTERPPLVGEVRGCHHMVRVTYPYGHILGFLDQSRYSFFQVAPQLYSRGRVDLVPEPLLLRKSGSVGNRIRTSQFAARKSNYTQRQPWTIWII
jgi:hypothetical protein